MIKRKINTRVLRALKPCQDRFDNWIKYYNDFDGDIVELLDLPLITHSDKIWVATKILPTTLVVTFAIDCSTSSQKHAASVYAYAAAAAAGTAVTDVYTDAGAAVYAAGAAAVYAADAAADAAATYAADADAARKKEEQSQIESLIWLIQNHKKGD